LKAHLISPEDVPYLWDNVGPMIAKVTDQTEGEFEPDDYLESLIMGHMQLWLATEDKEIIISMITQIIPYPQKRVLRVIALAGKNFKEVHDNFIDVLETFAIKSGCSSLELWGRKGWKKMLSDWDSKYIVFTKDLKSRMH
jgi:hypothetical protein